MKKLLVLTLAAIMAMFLNTACSDDASDDGDEPESTDETGSTDDTGSTDEAGTACDQLMALSVEVAMDVCAEYPDCAICTGQDTDQSFECTEEQAEGCLANEAACIQQIELVVTAMCAPAA